MALQHLDLQEFAMKRAGVWLRVTRRAVREHDGMAIIWAAVTAVIALLLWLLVGIATGSSR